MNRITRCSAIASEIAWRIGLGSVTGAGAAGASLLSIGRGSGWLAAMEASWLSVGLDLRRRPGLQRQGVDRSADLTTEDLVHDPVLLYAAASLERRGGH